MPRPTRPLVGITADFAPATKVSSAHVRLHPGYCDAIVTAGGLPLILPLLGKGPELDALLERCDGIVLSGGADVDPRRWGLTSHPAVQPMAERREENDKAIVRRVIEHQLPVLGIGLGMQQLNLAMGGTLYLHLPEDLPRAMPHRDPSGGTHRHLVLLEPGTRMEEIYGGVEVRVNSGHHMAVRQPAKGLRVGAKSPDGVIEAIEAVDANWFCVGVQWHPESETASALDMQLFECFVQACLRHGGAIADNGPRSLAA
jgi:putative glutamine amidotransferase